MLQAIQNLPEGGISYAAIQVCVKLNFGEGPAEVQLRISIAAINCGKVS
jgi:hypothetical protein